MPTFIPLLPGFIQALGGGNVTYMSVAVDVGSHLVDVSPLSTLGELCLAAVPETVNRQGFSDVCCCGGINVGCRGSIGVRFSGFALNDHIKVQGERLTGARLPWLWVS